MRKLFSFSAFIIAFLLLGASLAYFSGCATLQNWISQPQLQTYTFNYDGNEYSALLPKEVPLPPEKAKFVPHAYTGGIYAMHVWYMEGEKLNPEYPISSFWLTKKLGIVALVYHTLKPDGSQKRVGWLYIKGLPIPTNKEGFNDLMDELAGKQ